MYQQQNAIIRQLDRFNDFKLGMVPHRSTFLSWTPYVSPIQDTAASMYYTTLRLDALVLTSRHHRRSSHSVPSSQPVTRRVYWLLFTDRGLSSPRSAHCSLTSCQPCWSHWSSIAVRSSVIVGGDIIVHVEDPSNALTACYLDLLSSMHLQQHVTHISGGILDHVITHTNFSVDQLDVDPPGSISDHSVITGRSVQSTADHSFSPQLKDCRQNRSETSHRRQSVRSASTARYITRRPVCSIRPDTS